MKLISLTDIGIKRSDNQDNYWASRLSINGEEAGVICLCDGMGGLNNGALTSRTVVTEVKKFFMSSIDFKDLEMVIKDVNTLIHDKISQGGQSGTTCTVLFCYKGHYKILHVGDSRCYLKSDEKVSILTEDHTVIARYEKQGKVVPDRLVKKYRNVLTRCVGASDHVTLDYMEGKYKDGDLFLVCSDGFWHYLDDESFFNGDLSNIDGVRSLVNKMMYDYNETDNITVGVLEV